MKKRFVLIDWYVGIPDYLGEYDTAEEAEKIADRIDFEQDGDTDIIIYDRSNEQSAKLLANIGQ